jgi:hypothetical protein
MSRTKNPRSINLLDLVPVRHVEWEVSADGLVTLLRPKFGNRLLRKHLLPRMKRPCYRIHLDKFGSTVWNLCDGSRSVDEIGEGLLKRFGEEVEPVYDRLALFVQHLDRSHFIRLPLPAGTTAEK